MCTGTGTLVHYVQTVRWSCHWNWREPWLEVGVDKILNIARARKAIREAAAGGAALVVLPEMWNCPYSNDSFPVYAEEVGRVGDKAAKASKVGRSRLNLSNPH